MTHQSKIKLCCTENWKHYLFSVFLNFGRHFLLWNGCQRRPVLTHSSLTALTPPGHPLAAKPVPNRIFLSPEKDPCSATLPPVCPSHAGAGGEGATYLVLPLLVERSMIRHVFKFCLFVLFYFFYEQIGVCLHRWVRALLAYNTYTGIINVIVYPMLLYWYFTVNMFMFFLSGGRRQHTGIIIHLWHCSYFLRLNYIKELKLPNVKRGKLSPHYRPCLPKNIAVYLNVLLKWKKRQSNHLRNNVICANNTQISTTLRS